MQQEDLLFEKLGDHEERLVRIEDKLDNVEGKLDNHEIRLIRIEENMATKEDLHALEDRLLTRDDKQIALLTIIRDEQVATHHALLRHENKLEEHDGAIKQLQTDFKGFQTKPQTI
ncbi:hypothetical protein A3H75_00035 [Candidatus Uhrbacteria bacterium RIFCSPLOWO2_02_FULL_51_9]|uniref:Uncharacterized protein n=1 Tax=Candidatus Uhrbacteria bacterium RIFCSPLOWO2_02_FULL_51_9 TaxID=1802410 RepID=A0A1F7VE65_9BACT|nr:MAG: hypothetical protein A3H75_00035 [Candidatus Uhrbacteria bacterium RIFCSPLOWO2_02_FULL_51_9]